MAFPAPRIAACCCAASLASCSVTLDFDELQAGAGGAPGGGTVFWYGRFDTESLEEWNDLSEVQASRVYGSSYEITDTGDSDIQIVTDTVRQGPFAAEHIVYPDSPSTNGEENAVLYTKKEYGGLVDGTLEGTDYYYHVSVYFPLDDAGGPQNWWSGGNRFNWITLLGPVQIGIDATSSPVVIYAQRYEGGVAHDETNSANLDYEKWYEVVIHIKWSVTDGAVELWLDGDQKISAFGVPTMKAGDDPRWNQGLSRGVHTAINRVVQDGACRGDTYAAVEACAK